MIDFDNESGKRLLELAAAGKLVDARTGKALKLSAADNRSIGDEIADGLAGLADKLERGESIDATRVRREDTPDGPIHTRETVTITAQEGTGMDELHGLWEIVKVGQTCRVEYVQDGQVRIRAIWADHPIQGWGLYDSTGRQLYADEAVIVDRNWRIMPE